MLLRWSERLCAVKIILLLQNFDLCNGKRYRKLGRYLAELFYYTTLDVFCSAIFFQHIRRVTETVLELYLFIFFRETETALDVFLDANMCQSLQILLVIVPWHLNEQEINSGNACVCVCERNIYHLPLWHKSARDAVQQDHY